MQLNTISPASGHKNRAKRVGRGMGSGLGKTCGRGHKGQKSRSGGRVRPGFEGGQMPLQKRVPKYGFSSRVGLTTAKIRLSELNAVQGDVVDVQALIDAGLAKKGTLRARVFLSGEIGRAITVKGLKVSAGAAKAIEAAGGKIEE